MLDDVFVLADIRLGSNNEVKNFFVKYKDENPDWMEGDKGFEVSFHEDGYYWTNISYGANEDMFGYFRRLTSDISEKLRFLIRDPQIGETYTPEDFGQKYDVSKKREQFAKKAMSFVVNDPLYSYRIPVMSRYFTKYFLLSREPVTKKAVMLMVDEDQQYCSKVEKGELLEDIILRDVMFLTASKEFEVLEVKDGGVAKDRFGNDLPRKDILIGISYFDPKTRELKRTMSWSYL